MKTVLITGAANGIGYHLMWYFLDSGYKVVMVDKDSVALDKAYNKLIKHFTAKYIKKICSDITAEYSITFIKNSIKEFGEVNILINNAGIGQHSTLLNTTSDRIAELMRVNFFAAENLIKAFVPTMIERGSGQIINVCSGQVFFNLPTWAAYTSTKAALSSYSEALYHELKPKGIAVTTVYPFMVNTQFYDNVKTTTLTAKLSMMLLPLYSMHPNAVARKIFHATMNEKRREMISKLNYVGQFISVFPQISNIVGKISNLLLTK